MKHIKTTIQLAVLSAAFISCGPSANEIESQVNIINGKDITESDYPAVQQIIDADSGECTGTFVSDNTMLYAAHCGRKPALPNNGKIEPIKSFVFGDDMAVARFPEGTSKHWVPILNRAPIKGEIIRLVGYGSPGWDKKRTGTNTIHSLPKEGRKVWSERRLDNDSTDNAGAAPGDSGGPLLIEENDKTYTFATLHGRARPDQDGGRMATYENLCHPDALNWLKGLVEKGEIEITGFEDACGGK